MQTKYKIFVITLIIVVTSAATGTSVFARSCRVSDSYWKRQMNQSESALIERVNELGSNVAEERSITAEKLLAALQVFTKQTSADGQKEQAMTQSASEAFASTVTEQHRREKLAEIKEQFGADTGNGVNSCASVQMIGSVMDAIDSVVESASRNVGNLDVAPGKVTSRADAVALRLDPSSTDAAVLLDIAASADQKNRFISQLAGMPPVKTDITEAGNATGDVMMIRARRLEALRSPALVSLSAVAAMSGGGGHSGGGGASVVEAMDELIDQYGGGPKYQQWSAGVAAQSERGLVIELTRLRALHLRLKQVNNDQDARLASVFATMVATKMGGDL